MASASPFAADRRSTFMDTEAELDEEDNSEEEEEEEEEEEWEEAGSSQDSEEEVTPSSIFAKVFLGLVGVVLSLVTTVTDLALQGLVSKEGGIVMLAALTATRASLSWAATLFSFVFLGGMSLIGTALGQGDDLKAGRYVRILLIIAMSVGVVGAVVLATCAKQVLGLFHQEEVSEDALPFFRLSAMFFPLAVLTLALNGILLGLLYVHVVVVVTCIAGAIGLASAFALYLGTDLGLPAFAISTALGAAFGVALTMAYLYRSERRKKFGLDLGLSGISWADVHDLGSSMGCLAFRSFVVNTPYLLTIVLSIRMSPVHGAVFQFLISQSGLVDNVVSGFAMAVNFFGARLWGAKLHAAFWNVLVVFFVWICTPMAITCASLEIHRGRESLAKTFAKDGEQALFDGVMTPATFTIYILFLVVRAYYIMIEQAMIAMQELKKLALIQGVSFVVYLCVAIYGYSKKDFTTLFLSMLLFLSCRIIGGSIVLGHALTIYKFEWYKHKSFNDPQYALKLTIDDPAAARIFGGRSMTKSKLALAEEDNPNLEESLGA